MSKGKKHRGSMPAMVSFQFRYTTPPLNLSLESQDKVDAVVLAYKAWLTDPATAQRLLDVEWVIQQPVERRGRCLVDLSDVVALNAQIAF